MTPDRRSPCRMTHPARGHRRPSALAPRSRSRTRTAPDGPRTSALRRDLRLPAHTTLGWAAENGHLPSPLDATYQGYRVGIWSKNARVAARKVAEIEQRHAQGLQVQSAARALSEERREQLEEHPFCGHVRDRLAEPAERDVRFGDEIQDPREPPAALEPGLEGPVTPDHFSDVSDESRLPCLRLTGVAVLVEVEDGRGPPTTCGSSTRADPWSHLPGAAASTDWAATPVNARSGAWREAPR